MKKFIILNICITITAFAFIQGYMSVNTPVFGATGWENVTSTEELAEAFRYYCKSRDLTIEGSVLDGVTSFTTQTFNNICDRLGLNITAIQADLKKSTDGNLGVQYLFNSSGIATYNRIFAQFLQDNDLEVGDEVDDKELINGRFDSSSNAFLYVFSSDSGPNIISYGTSYPFTYSYLTSVSMGRTSSDPFLYNYSVLGNSLSIRSFKAANDNFPIRCYVKNNTNNNQGDHYIGNANDGTLCVGYVTYNNSYIIAGVYKNMSGVFTIEKYVTLSSSDANQYISIQNVYITTNNNPINNNTYQNNTYTTINNDGDVNNYNTDQEPGPGDTPSVNPSPITPPSDSGGSDGDVSFPNFNFKFPEINWSLGDLSSKFPFSIPFDLVAFYTVLNAEPRAPAVDAEIPLGDFYNWHFEADFSQFDNYAVIIRNVEYISFVVALIYITVKFVKG